MPIDTSYAALRTQVAAVLSGALGFRFLDFTPSDPTDIFGNLPAGVVDYDQNSTVRWSYPSQAAESRARLLVEIYEAIVEGDNGRTASENIAADLQVAEAQIMRNQSLNQKADDLQIIDSKIEGLAVEMEKTGIKARFAWLLVEAQHIRV